MLFWLIFLVYFKGFQGMAKNNFDSNELNYLNMIAAGLVHEIKNPLNTININL